MPESRIQRKMAAILCADVEGYSRLMGADEEGTLRALESARKTFFKFIAAGGGRVISSPGDAVLAEFPSVVDALRSAVEIQGELARSGAALPPEKRMAFRIGINLGDVMVKGEDIFGDGVNIAARLEALAEGGGICVSGTAYDQVKSREGWDFEPLGEQQVKNISEPVRVYRVVLESAVPPPASEPLTLPEKPSIAVLAFDNLSGDPEQSYFSDGIAEDIITDLSKISGLFVIARNSSFTYKGGAVDLRRVGEDLGVRYVLEGSVRKGGERVRITAQLIEAHTGHHVWAERYDRKIEDVFAVQDEISEEIVTALEVKLVEGEQARALRNSLKNPEARDLFYRARELFHRIAREPNAEARGLFRRVALLEPESAEGFAGEASCHYFDAWRRWTNAPEESMQQAFGLAQKALEADDTSGDAHTVRGLVFLAQGKGDQAASDAERALELAPSGAEVHAFCAMIYNLSGDPERGRQLARQARRFSPLGSAMALRMHGVACRLLGLWEEGISVLREAVALEPEITAGRTALIFILCAAGRFEEARTEAEALGRVDPHFSLEKYARNLPFDDPVVIERGLENLRKAGLI